MEISRMRTGYLLGLSATAKEGGGKENEKNDCQGSYETHVDGLFLTTLDVCAKSCVFCARL